jgi:hypothetical protein
VAATEGESALTERAQRQGVWALTGGPGRRAHMREEVPAVRAARSESDGGDQTRGNKRLWAALFLSVAVRSPELRLARARGSGSPGLGREEEGATANSMAGKGP